MFGYAAVRLGELFDTRNGYTPSKSEASYWDQSGNIPWFRMEDLREGGRILSDAAQHITSAAIKGTPIPANSLIVSTSATIGEHALITVPFLANQRFTCLTVKKEYDCLVEIKYLFYFCYRLSDYCKQHLNQGNFASVDMGKFYDFEFMIPTIAEQKRIISILDRFDSLCNDISNGIPAEIEARRIQYEFYRDKLLSFQEIKV